MKIWKEDNTLLKVKEMIQTKPSDNEVFRYLVYDNDYQSSNEAKVFTSYEKAINYAVNHNSYEVEQLIWYNKKDYNNRKEADKFKSVWKNF